MEITYKAPPGSGGGGGENKDEEDADEDEDWPDGGEGGKGVSSSQCEKNKVFASLENNMIHVGRQYVPLK